MTLTFKFFDGRPIDGFLEFIQDESYDSYDDFIKEFQYDIFGRPSNIEFDENDQAVILSYGGFTTIQRIY